MNGLIDREAEPELLASFFATCPQREMQLRNAVDSVAQHRHLSETASEPSTLDRPTTCSD
jgi:hypothetical protein